MAMPETEIAPLTFSEEEEVRWASVKEGLKQLFEFCEGKPYEWAYELFLGHGCFCVAALYGLTVDELVSNKWGFWDSEDEAEQLVQDLAEAMEEHPEYQEFLTSHPHLVEDFLSCHWGKEILKKEPDFFRYMEDDETRPWTLGPDHDKWGIIQEDFELYDPQREGRWLAASSADGRVFLWPQDHPSPKPPLVRCLDAHTNVCTDMCVDWEMMMTVSTGHDAQIKVHDLHSGRCVLRATDPAPVQIEQKSGLCLDGDLQVKKAAVGTNQPAVRIVDLAQERFLMRLSGHTGDVSAVKAEWDENLVVSCSWDRQVLVHDLRRGPRAARRMEAHTQFCNTVACDFTRKLAISAAAEEQFILWDLTKASVIRKYPNPGQVVACLSVDWPNGRLATGGDEGAVKVWDLVSGNCTSMVDCEHIQTLCMDVDWEADLLCTGSWNRKVQLFRLSTGQVLKTYRRVRRCVTQVRLMPSALEANRDLEMPSLEAA